MKKQVIVTDPEVGALIETYQADGAIFTAYQLAADNCQDYEFRSLVKVWNEAKKEELKKAAEHYTEELLEYEIVIFADTPETLATRKFLQAVHALVSSDTEYRQYGETRLKLIHSSRRELFLRLLQLGYELKKCSVLLARLEVEAPNLQRNGRELSPEELLEILQKFV